MAMKRVAATSVPHCSGAQGASAQSAVAQGSCVQCSGPRNGLEFARKLIAADLEAGLGVRLELGWEVVWNWCGDCFGFGLGAGL